MPGQVNMVSVITAPATRLAKFRANSVNTGTAAFLKACFQITTRRGMPFPRNNLIYSEFKTSSMEERTIRMWAATKNYPNATEGRMRAFSPERLTPPALGNQPRYTEKKRINKMAVQKTGIDWPAT